MSTRVIALIALIFLSILASQSRARDDGEFDPPIPEPPSETRPNPPSVKVLWKTANSVKLEWWDRSRVENGYKLREKESDGNWTVIGDFKPLDGSPPRQSYEIMGLFPDTEYCFQVIAYNDKGYSGPAPIQEACTYTASEKSCTKDKIEEVLALASSKPEDSVRIDCDLTLEPGQVVTKRLIFDGIDADRDGAVDSSGVTVDLNGATLGAKGTYNFGKDMIQIMSTEIVVNNTKDEISSYRRPQDITIRNGNIIGSVRIWGMAQNGQGDWEFDKTKEIQGFHPPIPFSNQLLKSSRMSGHTARVQTNGPRNIVFDNVTITGLGRNPLYFAPGVTNSKLINSKMNGKSNAVAIYLDAETEGNTIKNNYIHVSTKNKKFERWDRPLIAIDGSSNNKIINNLFSNLSHGGIYLYRNCGEGGVIRHLTPSRNKIINNIFYYNKYNGDNPSVYLSSRNRGGVWDDKFGFCDEDDGYPFGSSVSDRDYARYNAVMQNQIYKRSINDMIKTKNAAVNSPNYIDYNQKVTEETVDRERPAGCNVEGGRHPNFILDGQSFDLWVNGNPPTCHRDTCNDGDLIRSPSSTCGPYNPPPTGQPPIEPPPICETQPQLPICDL